PVIPTAEATDTIAAAETKKQAAPDTVTKTKLITPPPPPVQPKLSASSGLLAEFKDVAVLITNISAKIAGHPNLQKVNGAVYTLVSGNLNGTTMRLTGTITKVSQRYQTVILLKNNMGTLELDAFTTTTDWEAIRGGNNQYRITGLDVQSLDHPDANANSIRNAVAKA